MDERLLSALSEVNDPELHKDLVTLGMIKEAELADGLARITVELTTPACPLKDRIRGDIEAAVDKQVPGTRVEIQWTAQVKKSRRGGGLGNSGPIPSLEEVKNIILVASGKGGVGKSTVSANLACALAATGSKIGLMDADIYGPSIPTMFNMHDEVFSKDGKTIEAHVQYGLKLMSMGFFVPPDKAMIWRGPMLMSAVTQFLKDVAWGELDYLIIDLPPGTGDVQLTLAQTLKVTGAVIVSTPQSVAIADVVRAKAMFDSVNIPILGLVENMSYFVCDGCDKKHFIFDEDGGKAIASEFGIEYLGDLPIEPALRASGDQGMPIVEEDPDSDIAQRFLSLARKLAGIISVRQAQAPPEAEPPRTSAEAKRSLPIVN